MFSLTGALLGFDTTDSDQVGPNDVSVFRSAALACVGVGRLMSVIFHLTVKVKESDNSDYSHLVAEEEKCNDDNCDVTGVGQEIPKPESGRNSLTAAHITPQPSLSPYQRIVEPMSVKNWFSEPQFYQVAMVYMATRLFINISQAYIPLYIQKTLVLKPVSIAVIPLIMFLSGFIVSMINKPISKLIGRKWSMVVGCVLGLIGSIWVYFGAPDWESFTSYQVCH